MWNYPQDPKECSSLVLAYIGDAVFELYVRMYLVAKGGAKVKDLNHDASNLVRASSQADFLRRLETLLSEEEMDVFRRGRNAKSGTVPKNADLQQYRVATGFEALIGYLFLTKKDDRLKYLLDYLFSEEEQN